MDFPDDPSAKQQEEMPQYKATIAKLNAGAGFLDVAATQPHFPSVTELLKLKQSQLEQELALVNAALKKAEENTGAMDLIDSIAKTRVSSRL